MDYYVAFYIGGNPRLHEERIRDCKNEAEAIEKLYAVQDDAELAECSIPGVPAVYPVQ